jgi:hypothetical protein
MELVDSLLKPTNSFSKKCIINYQLHVFGEKGTSRSKMYSVSVSSVIIILDSMRFIEVNKHFLESRDHKLLCYLHSLLNEVLNFS